MKTMRQKNHELRQQGRQILIAQRKAKLAAARCCYETAKFYHENNSLPGVMYWESEYNRCLAEAGAVSR